MYLIFVIIPIYLVSRAESIEGNLLLFYQLYLITGVFQLRIYPRVSCPESLAPVSVCPAPEPESQHLTWTPESLRANIHRHSQSQASNM